MSPINKVCVIGAGVMGSAIAAQIANSRTSVILLDIAGPDPQNYNLIVNEAFNKIKTQKPPPLSHLDLASYITLGNLKQDLMAVKDCDLIIEAIIEQLEAKHNLYRQIAPFLKETAILASNTSTVPLAKLKKNMPNTVKNKLIITHFFNPPRYMELVELISDNKSDINHVKELSEFLTYKLGKTVVRSNDTPGFIANRIGCFLLELTVRSGIKANLNPAKIDLIFAKLFGFPSTGVFGLYDLIGHDVMELISASLINSLPKTDKYRRIYLPCETLSQMRRKKFFGRKSGAGFYRFSKQDEVKIFERIDFYTLNYSPLIKEQIPGSIEELLTGDDEYARYFLILLREFFCYVISLVPSVTVNASDIDKAMKLGYNLNKGPFELLTTGLGKGKRLAEYLGIEINGINITVSNPDFPLKKTKIIKENDSAKILDYNDDLILIIDSKMNCLNPSVFSMILDSCQIAQDKKRRIYIYPSGTLFSAGADIKYLKENIEVKKFNVIEQYITLGQKAMTALKHSKSEIVSCAKGIALGGGCEILLHSDIIVANQNLNAGLVELGVGLIPGWGGIKEMFLRSEGDIEKLVLLLRNILEQNKSSSADYFSEDYRALCKINMHKDYLLSEAVTVSIDKPPLVTSIKIKRFDLGSKIDTSNYDAHQTEIIDFFQKIINLGDLTEEKIMEYEKEKFLELCSRPLCLERLSKFI